VHKERLFGVKPHELYVRARIYICLFANLMYNAISNRRRLKMPVISVFYGIIIQMYFFDNKQHHLPHIHARYQGKDAVFNIETAEVLEGKVPPKQTRLIQAWVEIHKEDLMADWELAVSGQQVFQIDPLR
jgi:hypothetical protein